MNVDDTRSAATAVPRSESRLTGLASGGPGWTTLTDTVRGLAIAYAGFSVASAIVMASLVRISDRPVGPASTLRLAGEYSGLATNIADLASFALLLVLVAYNVWSARTRRLPAASPLTSGRLLRHWTLRTWRIAAVANILLGLALQATFRRRPTMFMDHRAYLITVGRPILSAAVAVLLIVGLTHTRRVVRSQEFVRSQERAAHHDAPLLADTAPPA